MNRFFALILMLLVGPLQAGEPAAPPTFWASYEVNANGLKIGEMTRSLKALGPDHYVLETDLYTTGIVAMFKSDRFRERSEWTIDEQGYKPLKYSSHYTGRSKDVVERLTFDWDRGVVVSLRDGKEKKVPVAAGVFDKLMYQAALLEDLANGKTRLSYRVADRGKIEDYEFQVLGREDVLTSLGRLSTIKVRKGTTTLWCAIDYDYLPVRLEQDEDTHTVSSEITALRLGSVSNSVGTGAP